LALFTSPLSDVVSFINGIESEAIEQYDKNIKLSASQIRWIATCMTAMVVTGVLCFARIQRATAGFYAARALSSMLHYSKIDLGRLYQASILRLIKLFGAEGVLVVDDTDRLRAKSTSKLFGIQKVFDKKTGGYSQAQNLVVLLFVTKKMTFPVGFRFYIPEPAWIVWMAEDKKQRLLKVPKRDRPRKPLRSADYPTKITIAGDLISVFKSLAPSVKINAVCADAAFAGTEFTNRCESLFPNVQVLSQIRSNQIVQARGQKKRLWPTFLKIRYH
jgi:DDE superfamily endonuclease